jgi:NADH dehydrogenase (ubiquinone) 1 alpha/beta subcomplex 1
MSLSRLLPRISTLSRVARSTPTLQTRWVPRAMYSAGGGLSHEAITSRVLETLKGYEKIDPAKVSLPYGFQVA